MRSTKTHCWLWTGVTLVGVLAGCGGSSPPTPEPDASKTATAAAPVKPAPKAKAKRATGKLVIPDEDTGHSLRRKKQQEQNP